MVVNNSVVKFSIGDKLNLANIYMSSNFQHIPCTDVRLCVVDVVKEYLARIKPPANIVYLGGLKPP